MKRTDTKRSQTLSCNTRGVVLSFRFRSLKKQATGTHTGTHTHTHYGTQRGE